MEQLLVPDGYEETTTKFEPEGVTIRIQTKKITVCVKRQDPEIVPLPPFDKYGRFVMAYDIVRGDGGDFGELDRPYELEVRYTADDVRLAGDYKSLKLCFAKNDGWVDFSEDEHKFRLVPDRLRLESYPEEMGGVGRVYIKPGSDPSIGWNT